MIKHTDEQIAQMNHQEFVMWFMEYNKKRINQFIYRRMIPNRYSASDIKAYIVERILDILQKREAKDKAIKDPKTYFYKLIDFWCIEFQRMHGYCYGMPKRPRCPEAEQEIAQYGFVYLYGDGDGWDGHSVLGYIDATVDDPCDAKFRIGGNSTIGSVEDLGTLPTSAYHVRGLDPDVHSVAWMKIMKMALPEDREVLTCLFRRNMSVPEASRHLDIAISTAYARKERGLKAISGTLSQYIDLDKPNWEVLAEVTGLDWKTIDISQFFHNVDNVMADEPCLPGS